MTPEGLRLLIEIDEIIENDPDWPKLCLMASETNRTCAGDPSIGGKIAKISPIPIFKTAYGEDLSELTQFSIDFAMFGLAYSQEYFDYTIPLFSTEYTRTNRKAKMTRFLLQNAGPIEFDGIRYRNMGDQNAVQEL